MEPLGVRGTLLKMSEFGRNGLFGSFGIDGDSNKKHDNDFVRAADFLVHFAAVAFAYIEE